MNELLKLAIDAHGGLERWKSVKSIDVRISLTGGLYVLKGHPEGVVDVNFRINPHQLAASMSPYPRFDQHGFFTPDRVWIEDRSGKIVEERKDPRPHFAQPLEVPWDNLDRLYFTSYALLNYLTAPFLFAEPGFEVREVEVHKENGQTWRCLQVKYPKNVPTHSPEQTLFFNEQGLLQRLDYLAVGPASHYCYDHANFNGIVFPMLRRVVPQAPDGENLTGPTAVLLRITDIDVR